MNATSSGNLGEKFARMNTSSDQQQAYRGIQHKIWTKRGEKHILNGQLPYITESEKTSEVCSALL